MKFVFFGTPEFAAVILQKLVNGGFTPTAVVCNPDRPVGRKKVIMPPPVKRLIADGGWQIEVLQPNTMSELLAICYKLSAIKPAFAIVAAYAKIIPKEILNLFPKGVIGVHPSLLPKYRGATPIQSAILAGEAETGVTLFILDEKMDHGPILAQQELEFSIINFQFSELRQKLANLGGELLVKTLPDFIAGKIMPHAQNEVEATYTKKFASEDAFVAPEDLEKALAGDHGLAVTIDRKVRALNPEPGVWTYANENRPRGNPFGMRRGGRVKLLEADLEGGRLILKKIQVEGEKPKVPNK